MQINKLVSQIFLLLNLAVFGYRGKGSKTTFLQTLNWILPHFPLVKRNIRRDASSYELTIHMFWIKNILQYALERKVSSIFIRTLRMMFSLSFVGGSKSAEGGPYPLTDLDRGVHIRQRIWTGGPPVSWRIWISLDMEPPVQIR